MKIYNETKIKLKMNYVNFNNFQPLNEAVYTREEAKTAILMVETKNEAKANKLVSRLNESGNDMKSILSLVENKLEMISALKSAKELLERNAFLGALAKAREAKAKTFEFNGKEYEVFGADVSEEEVVEEKFKYTEDQVNMAYGFYGSLESVYKEAQVQKMFTDAVADLMKAFKISEEVALLVLNAPIGRHTADMLYSKFAATASEGILKYFGGSEAKAKNFINQMHKANEAMNPNTELKEALTSKKPNEVETIELDMAWDDSDKEEDKAAKAAFKKYKLTVKGANGQPGTYEMTGKKKDILAYLQSEFYDMDADTVEEYYPELLEANSNYGAPAGLSKAETKKVAETLAKAISKNDGVKCTVNLKTLEEDSFDLDIDGEEFDGGSYNIYDDGSVRNMAVRGEKYGTITSTVEDFIKVLKKPVKESVINEATMQEIDKKVQKFVIKNANDYEYSNQDSAFQIYLSLKKLYPTLIKESTVNEAEVDLYASIETELSQIYTKLSDLAKKTTDPKWKKAIESIINGFKNVENKMGQASSKLGIVSTNESHFKVGDKVKMSHGGVGVIKSLDKEEGADDEKYYNVELANGDVHKHSPNELTKEANDHEVKMANGQLLDIAKNASELMKKIGETEKDLPGWIQDHISQAQNFLNQANTGYHELEEAKKYDLGFGSLGNGTTVWNRAQQVNGDYKTVAHISVGGNITYYDKKMPEDVKRQIEDMAANESVLTEGKVKQFEMDLESMIKDIKRGIGWIDPEYVGDSWENSNDTIDFSIVKAEVFKRLLDAGVLYFSDENGEEKGKAVKSSDLPSIMKMYESLVTEKDEAVFIEFLNKDKNFKKDTKHFKSYDEAVKWAKANFDKFSPDMIKYESLEINEKNEVTVSLRYAVQANDIFDDMYRKLGEKESTDVFSFKSKTYAEDFIESLIMVGVPKNEIN
jgi:RNA polymerase-interacting CarD/CdnL/TRCF family regulator